MILSGVPAPPFDLSPEVLALCSAIERLLGRSEGVGASAPSPQLRRQNRVRTVQATAAIEGNTLSLSQVTDVLDGKRVRGPAREISEIKNAIAAYDLAPSLHPGSERDLLRAHRTLMADLAPDAGRYRRGNVGVIAGSRVAHVAPKADRVPALMRDLLEFAATEQAAPTLVRACVVHYEIEFIHPFGDGNGRVGRLWQHVMLRAHSPVFEHLPTESLIKEHQAAYYDALARSDRAGRATPFVLFMLEQLHESLTRWLKAFRPARANATTRLAAAAVRFGREPFSRKDYLTLHQDISAPTASRDLRTGVGRGDLRMQGDKATARYVFVPRTKGKRRGQRS